MPRTSPFPAPHAGLPYLLFRTTPRDRYLAGMLHEHRALTAGQIADLAFSTLRRANQRLVLLTELGVTDRIRPNPAIHPGSSPYVYTLGPQGALLVAAERDQSVKDLRYDRGALLRQSARPDLGHTLGCNTTIIHLTTRPDPATRLVAWWGPISCLRLWGDLIRPDAYLVTTHQHHGHNTMAGWFLEYDTGTESIHQLAAKLRGYHRFHHSFTGSHPLLIHLPTPGREARLHQVITEMYTGTCPVPLATTTTSLAGPGWLPAPGQTRHTATRYHLADLHPAFAENGMRLLIPTTANHVVYAPTPAWNPTARSGAIPQEDPPCSPASPSWPPPAPCSSSS
jgi:hypothetical protein